MNILIVTELEFPHGSAMASRIINFSNLFMVHHNVHVIACHTTIENLDFTKSSYFNGISYEIVKKGNRTSIESFIGTKGFVNHIEKYVSNNKVDVIFACAVHAKIRELFSLCKKKNIYLLLEQCEWYDVSSYKLSYLDYRYIRFSYNIRKLYPKANGIISISHYLNNYYLNKKSNSICVPSIFDVKNTAFNLKTNNNKIRLLYAGNTSKSKDIIVPIIEALASKSIYKDNFVFNLYGINEKQLNNSINNSKLINDIKNCVFANGYVDKATIEKEFSKTDYQIFIRPLRRSSNAGFPTKFAESMAHGIPIISNLTSDLGLYLIDGDNGFICEGTNVKDIQRVFDKLLIIDKKQAQKMRFNARKTAEENFDYRNYVEIVDKLLKGN